MAATLLEMWNLRHQPGVLKQRATSAIAMSARSVLLEDVGTANHANRLKWANAAIANAETWCETMFWGILSNATVQTNGEASTDAQIQAAVDQSVNTFANAMP